MARTATPEYCAECDATTAMHRYVWFDNAMDALLPDMPSSGFSYKISSAFGWALENTLLRLRVVHEADDIDTEELPRRSGLFVEAAKKRGMALTAIRGPFGYTNNFIFHREGVKHRFEGLPNVGWLNGKFAGRADDKGAVKKILQKHGFPVAPGRAFWQWSLEAAAKYGTKELAAGFALVAKPRNGSVARHVTTNITNEEALRAALKHAFVYSPAAIVERHIPGFVHRFTVVDGTFVACVRQVPAHVTGDGIHTIESLMIQKNARPERHVHPGVKPLFHPLAVTEETAPLLKRQGYALTDISPPGTRVWLADEPFMRYGGELEEVTDIIHPDNRALAQDVAKLFGMKLVALDFICEDVARSWKNQKCAILELNSLPSIEMHHFPSSGTPQDVAGAIADMALRYYK